MLLHVEILMHGQEFCRTSKPNTICCTYIHVLLLTIFFCFYSTVKHHKLNLSSPSLNMKFTFKKTYSPKPITLPAIEVENPVFVTQILWTFWYNNYWNTFHIFIVKLFILEFRPEKIWIITVVFEVQLLPTTGHAPLSYSTYHIPCF